MRILALAAATAAFVSFAGPANAVYHPPCYTGDCVYIENGAVCWYEQAQNGNWRTVCVGGSGIVQICSYTFPDTQPRC